MSKRPHLSYVMLLVLLGLLAVANPEAYSAEPVCLQPLGVSGVVGESLAGHNAVLIQEQTQHARLQLIEAPDPNTLITRGAIPVLSGVRIRGYDFNATHAFVADGDLSIYSIADLTQPQWLASQPIPTQAQNVTVTDSLALVTTAIGAMEIYDISSLPAMNYLTTLWLPSGISYVRIVIRDTLACALAADTYGDVYVLDLANPFNPQILAAISDLAPQVAAWQGDQLVIGGQSDLYVIDVSTPTQPQILGRHALADVAVGIALVGNSAYMTTFTGVTRFELSDPSAPAPLDSTSAKPGIGLHHVASRLYFSDTLSGITTLALDACSDVGGSGDCDGNGSVDWPDYLNLDSCLAGPEIGGQSGCSCVDLDADGAQSMHDAAVFQQRFGS